VLTGSAAALYAGPAIMLSYVLAGTAACSPALLCGICFDDSIAGSAYTYGYATLGELIAWIIGWDLFWNTRLALRQLPVAGAARWWRSCKTTASDCRRRSAMCRELFGSWSMAVGAGVHFQFACRATGGAAHATARFNLIAFLAILASPPS